MAESRPTDSSGSTGRSRAIRVLVVSAALLGVALVALVAVLLVRIPGDADRGGAEYVQLEVPQGASTSAIADLLVDAGVVDNAMLFRLRVRLLSADGDLKAGVYDLATGSSYGEVIDRLREGPDQTYSTVTIPEGFVIDQIAERLEEQAGIPAAEFSKIAKTGAAGFAKDHPYLADVYGGSLEGYLFPKTYRIPQGSTAGDVAEMMLDQFDAEIPAVDLGYTESRGMSLHDAVTLASMIEREAKVADERGLVSSVIYNRLDAGMRLEIDATIEYVLPGNRFRLKASDIRTDSPYNTYLHKGLPPGPIASPGIAALKAAAAPPPTEYLYYVLTGKDGSHTFCVTREEFLVAKKKSKEVFGQ